MAERVTLEQPTQDDNRCKILLIDPHQLQTLLQEGQMVRCMSGFPPGGDVLGVWYDHSQRSLAVVVEHPSFVAVPLGAELPKTWVVFEQIRE